MNTLGRTRKAKQRKQIVIAIHDDKPAINVKYRDNINHNAPEEKAVVAWDMMVEQWWEDAENIAHELGYSGVFSEGRSSGWLVPYYQYHNGKLYQGPNTGQGPEKGYPQYPDVSDSKERARFVRLHERIAELMANVPTMFRENLESL
jgi:hypothetical protein